MLSILTGAVAITAIRIEVLNAAAGGVMPARERRDDGETPVKWRVARRPPWVGMSDVGRRTGLVDKRPGGHWPRKALAV